MPSAEIRVFFNFRSPYCYLASKRLFELFDDYHADMLWRPLKGWDGRSAPERAKVKVPLSRQDMSRWCRRLGIPFTPPPITTDPTAAAMGSLLAEEKNVLRPYIIEIMHAEWACGQDIGDREVLLKIGVEIGLSRDELETALDDPENAAKLEANWEEAQTLGVIGVPTFVIGEEIFWGNDRIDFVHEYLMEQRLRKI